MILTQQDLRKRLKLTPSEPIASDGWAEFSLGFETSSAAGPAYGGYTYKTEVRLTLYNSIVHSGTSIPDQYLDTIAKSMQRELYGNIIERLRLIHHNTWLGHTREQIIQQIGELMRALHE